MKKDNQVRQAGLARALSKLGYCSRSQALLLIRAGRVRLNRRLEHNPERAVRLGIDRIEVDDSIFEAQAKVYVMLNKPRGAVTTTSDEKKRRTVYEYIDPQLPWVAPVGRLDKASEGLLLLTNDSEWAARVTAPATHLDKVYHVQVSTLADETLTETLTNGVFVETRERLRAKNARILRKGERNTWLRIVLDEGRNRHIRRMMESLGIEVLRLIRVSIGPLALGNLAKGACRALTASEKTAMDGAMRHSGRSSNMRRG